MGPAEQPDERALSPSKNASSRSRTQSARLGGNSATTRSVAANGMTHRPEANSSWGVLVLLPFITQSYRSNCRGLAACRT